LDGFQRKAVQRVEVKDGQNQINIERFLGYKNLVKRNVQYMPKADSDR